MLKNHRTNKIIKLIKIYLWNKSRDFTKYNAYQNNVIQDLNYAAITFNFWNLGYHTSWVYFVIQLCEIESLYLSREPSWKCHGSLTNIKDPWHLVTVEQSRFITILVQSSHKCFRLCAWEEQLFVLIPVFNFSTFASHLLWTTRELQCLQWILIVLVYSDNMKIW